MESKRRGVNSSETAEVLRNADDEPGLDPEDESSEEEEDVEDPPKFMEWYTPPGIRSDWGEVQPEIDTEWADLFLDLVYVGAAYKLGTVMAYGNTPGGHDPTDSDSIVMFVALFLAFYHSWQALNDFKSRFLTDDAVHHLLEIVQTVNLAFGVSHLRSTVEMRNAQNGHLFWISVAFAVDKAIALGRYLESYLMAHEIAEQHLIDTGILEGEAERETSASAGSLQLVRLNSGGIFEKMKSINFIQRSSTTGRRRASTIKKNSSVYTMLNIHLNPKHVDLRTRIKNTSSRAMLPLATQMVLPILAAAAAQYADVQQEKHADDDDGSSYSSYYYSFRRLAGSSSYYYGAGDDGDDNVTFTVAAPTLVVALWLSMSAVNILYYVIVFGGKLTITRNTVPLHLMYVLHRHGEWLMLLIGESLFSMLLSTKGIYADTFLDQCEVYWTYFCALRIAMLLHFNAFTYESWTPETHAMRRSARAGTAYMANRNIYYGSVLAMGIALKVHMVYVAEESQKAWTWLLFGTSLIWYWTFQFSLTLHTRLHKCENNKPLIVSFPCIQPGMEVELERRGKGIQRAKVLAVHDDEDDRTGAKIFDVEFKEDGRMQGDNKVGDNVKVIVTDDEGNSIWWNVKPLRGDHSPRGFFKRTQTDSKLEIPWFTVRMPDDYAGYEMHDLEIREYKTGGFLEYLRQYPSLRHRGMLPIIWCFKILLSLMSLVMPLLPSDVSQPYWVNVTVMLVIMMGYEKVNHMEYVLDEHSADGHGHDHDDHDNHVHRH
jgi:hypothetical protein